MNNSSAFRGAVLLSASIITFCAVPLSAFSHGFAGDRFFQLGIEAMIPVNSETGRNLGVIAQVHFCLDDFWPKIFGKPLFGR